MKHATQLRRIPISQLIVDKSYQRELVPKTLKMFEGGWDEKLAGTLTVCPRGDGTFAVMDGWHRRTKAEDFGIDSLDCKILNTATVEEEADIFVKVNKNRGNPTNYDILRGLAVAGDEAALNIARVVKRHGFRLGNGKGAKNVITAASALMRASDIYGLENLNHSLSLLRDVWNGNPDSLTANFILGFSRWFHYAPRLTSKVHVSSLILKLQKLKPSEVIQGYPEYVTSKHIQHSLSVNRIYNQKRNYDRISEADLEKTTSSIASAKVGRFV